MAAVDPASGIRAEQRAVPIPKGENDASNCYQRTSAWVMPPTAAADRRDRRRALGALDSPCSPGGQSAQATEEDCMAWKLDGQYFENCSCDVPCPCTVSLDRPADRERCNAFLVFEIESGEVDGVDVGGLSVAAMVDSPQVMSEGNWRLGVLIDE